MNQPSWRSVEGETQTLRLVPALAIGLTPGVSRGAAITVVAGGAAPSEAKTLITALATARPT